MSSKIEEKKKAIDLRKQGKTYSEILKEVPVAKSTISLWLREVGLSKPQKQKITSKRIEAQKRGAKARFNQRNQLSKEIKERAKKEVGKLSKRDLWLIGIALYWAEGSKEKDHSRNVPFLEFSNSDPEMVRLYIRWLIDIVGVNPSHIYCYLYIHQNAKDKVSSVKKKWIEVTGLPEKQISRVYYKKHRIKTVRKNVGDNYYGMLRIWVKRSTNLNRKVSGWIDGLTN